MFHLFVMLGTSLVVVQALMLFLWSIYLVRRNVSVVDIGWGVGFVAAVLVDFILGEGYLWRKILVLTIVSIWGLRLVGHLARRFIPERDDPRYQLLLRNWPYAGYPFFQVLLLFLLQGLLVALLSLPFALLCQNILPFFSTYEVFGLLIWMIGVVGETVADQQLHQFKQNPAHLGQVCDRGLWKYSRHPNYFFEWIVWIGYCIMAFSAPFGWLSLISPLVMLFLLLKVSGIPYAEAQALRTKGKGYQAYQTRTSPFFPWFSRPTVPPSSSEQEVLKGESKIGEQSNSQKISK